MSDQGKLTLDVPLGLLTRFGKLAFEMISERQIRYLLTKCETALGRQLTDLRARLLRHKNHDASIWELICLAVSLECFERVDHEPTTGMPDIIVRGLFGLELSLEATTVTSGRDLESDKNSDFTRWIWKQVTAKDIPGNGAVISIDRYSDPRRPPKIPASHDWSKLLKDPEWLAFIRSLAEHGQSTCTLSELDLSIGYRLKHDGFISSNIMAPEQNKDILMHPVYKAIRSKAEQANKKWTKRVRNRPIVLLICAPRPGGELSAIHDRQEFSVDRAIWNALLDPSEMSDLDQLNVLGRRLVVGRDGVGPDTKRLRVSGSASISAVVFVRLEHSNERMSASLSTLAKPLLYINRSAANPLSNSQLAKIKRMDFNAIELGPGWEAWQGTERVSRKERNLRSGGGWKASSGRNGGFKLKLPTYKVLQILAGEGTTAELFNSRDGSNLPLMKFKAALESKLELTAVDVVEGNPAKREEQQIEFTFKDGAEAVVARAKRKRTGN